MSLQEFVDDHVEPAAVAAVEASSYTLFTNLRVMNDGIPSWFSTWRRKHIVVLRYDGMWNMF